MVRRWGVVVVLAVLSFGLVAFALARLTATPERVPIGQPGPLVVIGVPEQTWAEVSARRDPSLWPLLDVGASGSVSVRATTNPTCTPDAWVSLSAGNGARVGCSTRPTPTVAGAGASWPSWSAWRARNDALRSTASIGLLATSLQSRRQCVAAVGPGAALAAADREGRVARYWPSASSADLSACAVTFVDLSAPDGGPVPDADAALGRVFEAVPGSATVLVTGLSDGTQDRPVLRALTAVGPRVARGTLWSPSTHQTGFTQAADVTATALARFGLRPDGVTGQELAVVPSTAPVGALLDRNRDLQAAITGADRAFVPFLAGLAVLYVLALAAVVAGWRRAGRAPSWLRPVAVLLAAVPVGSYLVGLLPWWQGGPVLLWLALGSVAFAGAVTLLALLGPWRRWSAGPAVVVAAVTAAVLALDLICGSPLQLIAPQGLQPLHGGRYYGMGNAGFGLFAGAVLLLAGLLAARLVWWDDADRTDRRLAAATVVLLGATAVLVDGWPSWGADFGGPPALVVGTAVLACLTLGVRFTWRRWLLLAALVVLVAAGLAVLDRLRPEGSRTHLGAFVQDVIDGEGPAVVGDKLSQNVDLLLSSPVSPLVPVGLVVAFVAVLRPDTRLGRPLRPLWTEIPLLRATVAAVLACWTVGFLLNDSGVGVPATGSQIVLPLLLSVAAVLPAVGAGASATSADGPSATSADGGDR